MKQRFLKKFLFLAVVFALTIGSAGSSGQAVVASPARLADHVVYLPVVLKGSPQPTIFGVDLTGMPDGGMPWAVKAGLSWTRITTSWAKIEPAPGERDWEAVAAIEKQMRDATDNRMATILIVEDTPAWALKAGFNCGAVAQEQFPALQAFLTDLVKRYSLYPYNVRYWEMWNEPDVQGWFGCWGTPNEPYFGGEHYGEMLKIAYPTIKALQPAGQVLVGGLLLNCDPRNPPAGSDCTPSTFLTGILQSGAANSFDGVSFHSYDYYSTKDEMYANPSWNTRWDDVGPAMTFKGDYLTEVLKEWNVPDKYLINTEFAVLCDTCAGSDAFEHAKAVFLLQGYVLSQARGYRLALWYSMIGWRNTGLLTPSLQPRPAYYALSFARQQLGEAQYVESSTLDEVDYHAFRRNTTTIWVLWAKDHLTHTVTLSQTPTAVYDVLGDPQAVDGVNLDVTKSPTYVVWTP